MKIDCISDLHGYKPVLNGGDLLIVAGDLTSNFQERHLLKFYEWLDAQPYNRKLVISGNHDKYFYECYLNECIPFRLKNTEYLCDSATEYQGFKIWGSPWTPTFCDWYFMKERGDEIKAIWDLIPEDTEILITHGPAFGIQDQVDNEEKFLGCEELRNAITRLKKLKLHVFGHIHEGYGKVIVNGVTHVNASIVDYKYRPVNKPIRVVL